MPWSHVVRSASLLTWTTTVRTMVQETRTRKPSSKSAMAEVRTCMNTHAHTCHIHTYSPTHARKHTRAHTLTHTHRHAYSHPHTYIHACMHTHAHAHIHTHMYVCMCVRCVCVYKQTHVHHNPTTLLYIPTLQPSPTLQLKTYKTYTRTTVIWKCEMRSCLWDHVCV